MIRVLECLCCKERLREMGKKRLWDNLIVVFQYLKEAEKKETICKVWNGRKKGNGFKLK